MWTFALFEIFTISKYTINISITVLICPITYICLCFVAYYVDYQIIKEHKENIYILEKQNINFL